MDEFEMRQTVWDERARNAQAYGRLLRRAETSDSGQAGTIARFLASIYNGHVYTFDLFDLRAVDVEISDHMLVCLDGLRWGRADLYKLVPDGDRRIERLCADWGLSGAGQR